MDYIEDAVMEAYGWQRWQDVLDSYNDRLAPPEIQGYCTECLAQTADLVHVDASDCYCPDCGEWALSSPFAILGVV